MLTRKQLKDLLRPVLKFIKYRILHIDDTPHRIALGVALALFVAYTPFLGLHLFLLIMLAYIFHANKVVALTVVWVNNPLTYILIYYPCYLLGHLLYPNKSPGALSPEQVDVMFSEIFSLGHITTKIFHAEYWAELTALMAQIGLEILLGGLIAGTFLGVVSYFSTKHFVIWYRNTRPHWHLSREPAG